jgi:succinate dehydrogenase / fumarate reductase iron-sulfur subunit
MQVSLKVRRYNPESNASPLYRTYQVEVAHYETVLDALIRIREEQDGTLALRCSCRSAICGSCAMRINKTSRLACKTKIVKAASESEVILVEPAANMPVVKDLVVNMTPFWDKVRAVEPWLQPTNPPPEREYIAPNDAMLHLAEVMNCIMCGACVSACTVLEAELKAGKPMESTFLGPAALAKAYRFAADPRDAAGQHRLRALSKATGVWDCTHCFYCIEACPKGVAPMDRIVALREKAMAAGFTNNAGARHSEAFAESVEHSGWLNEFTLLQKSIGWNLRELLKMIPGGLRMAVRGKTPSPIHRPIPGVEQIKRIFQNLDSSKKNR